MKFYNFSHPSCEFYDAIDGSASLETIEAEPMLFQYGINLAYDHGGPLTKMVLDSIMPSLKPGQGYIVDTKSVMLMPGMYPAIPGWHCDSVKRSDETNQPLLDEIDKNSFLWTCTISNHPGGVSNMEFLNEELTLPYDPNNVWGSIDHMLTGFQDLKTHSVADGNIYKFSQESLHRAMPCHQAGWRFFFRLAEANKRPENKIRKQVQIYSTESQGW